MRHPLAWKLLPFPLLAIGVFAFMWLADRYTWEGGTRLLIGLLMLALFALIAGPLALVPDLRRRRDETGQSGESLDDALSRKLFGTGVSTREGARFRLPD